MSALTYDNPHAKEKFVVLEEKFAPLSGPMLNAFLRSISSPNRSAAKFAVKYFPRTKGHAEALRFVGAIIQGGAFTPTEEAAVWALMDNLIVTVRLLDTSPRYEQAEMFA